MIKLISDQFGSKGTANSQFQSPYGLVLSQSELLFVCDNGNHRISVFHNEQYSYCFGQHGTDPGCFRELRDLTLNTRNDQLFISDSSNGVQVFTLKGQFLRVFGCTTDLPFTIQNAVGIDFTPDGHLLIGSFGLNCVLVFKEDGKFTSAIESTYHGKKRFSNPCGVLMMINGDIVIADRNTNRLLLF